MHFDIFDFIFDFVIFFDVSIYLRLLCNFRIFISLF